MTGQKPFAIPRSLPSAPSWSAKPVTYWLIASRKAYERQRVVIRKPRMAIPKPTVMFQAPIPGIGYWL